MGQINPHGKRSNQRKEFKSPRFHRRNKKGENKIMPKLGITPRKFIELIAELQTILDPVTFDFNYKEIK